MFRELFLRFLAFIMDTIQTIVMALALFVLFYFFIGQPSQVKGSSMDPFLYNNELLITDKVSYRFREPKPGEIVVFKSPGNKEIDYIKRIVALPGERVKVSNGRIYVNGQMLKEPYLSPEVYTRPDSFLAEDIEIAVPEGMLFVVGDNRPGSRDSRNFGPIPEEDVIGRAVLRYWPLNRIGLLPEQTP